MDRASGIRIHANNLAREILRQWRDWEADAGQQAQTEQDAEAYTDTMEGHISDLIYARLDSDKSIYFSP